MSRQSRTKKVARKALVKELVPLPQRMMTPVQAQRLIVRLQEARILLTSHELMTDLESQIMLKRLNKWEEKHTPVPVPTKKK